ncbi:ABC transporter substrate-binding protein [Nesterenkonia flava]|uniref:ABC transporter substrate-binding protein n=1 Tax=Nesterenkonia flava TaxID=469799 RepID=A0ABU1FPH6_9MICC|nr:ABC transporter substrate-binding protein [Nesterenkonia flava]
MALTAVAALALTSCSASDAQNDDEVTLVQSIGPLPHLNPQLITSPNVRIAAGTMLEPLVKMTDEYDVVPWLAHDWEISDDGTEATLYLQEGVTWHDGEPFTADDVKFNLDEVIQYQRAGIEISGAIDTVEVVDEHTVRVLFREPYGPFLQGLALQSMLPRHIYEGTDFVENPANSSPVGTGPLVMERFEEGSQVELVRNEDYWAGEVHIDRLIFAILTDPNAQDLALKSGELDRSAIDSARLAEVEADPDLAVTTHGSMPWQVFFNMNAQVEELTDPEVRRLVFSAVDIDALHEIAVPNNSTPAESIYPPGLEWAKSPEVDYLEDFAYNVEAINQGLDDAGYPVGSDGYRFSLELTFMSHLADARAMAEVIQSSMDEVGIRIELNAIEDTVYQEYVSQKGDFELALLIGGTETDPNLGITIWHECNPEEIPFRNPSGECDEELDQYAMEALRSVSEQERGEAFQKFEERAAEVMTSAPVVHMWPLTAYSESRWEGAEIPTRNIPLDWHLIRPKD